MNGREARELDYGITMAAQALVEALGMLSENLQRMHRGESMAYTEISFNNLINKHGIHHNAVIKRWENL